VEMERKSNRGGSEFQIPGLYIKQRGKLQGTSERTS